MIRGWDFILTGWRWLHEPEVGVPTPWGAVSIRGITVFVLGLSELSLYGRISDPEMGPYPHRVALALRTPAWVFHTVGGGIHQGDHRFCPRLVKVVDLWKDF